MEWHLQHDVGPTLMPQHYRDELTYHEKLRIHIFDDLFIPELADVNKHFVTLCWVASTLAFNLNWTICAKFRLAPEDDGKVRPGRNLTSRYPVSPSLTGGPCGSNFYRPQHSSNGRVGRGSFRLSARRGGLTYGEAATNVGNGRRLLFHTKMLSKRRR